MGVCTRRSNTTSNSTSGLGYCVCDPFYAGNTCDVYACHTYCYNNGICYVEPGPTPEIEPIAKVIINYNYIMLI